MQQKNIVWIIGMIVVLMLLPHVVRGLIASDPDYANLIPMWSGMIATFVAGWVIGRTWK